MPHILSVQSDDRRSGKLALLLGDLGHTVQHAASAEQALALIKQSRPDVVIADLVLPCMSGLLLCELLKANPHTRDIILIATTCVLSPEVDRVTRAIGFADCIHEDLDPSWIAARINLCVRHGQRERGVA